ncbi:hypothetical protein ABET51_03895 [Metabacillus fastidiosus]|uniref:hypothetical protein n=1 Tax=Metabacillus fastidiosus TaxID=1458 RepID=UPI003D2846B0
MFDAILSIVVVIVLIISIYYHIRKRKETGVNGIKSSLSPICFSLIAITNLFAYWFHFRGIISWGLTIVFLILGAYFTKYLLPPEKTDRRR